jgi:LysR family glycine cleavage system transcriptional activator
MQWLRSFEAAAHHLSFTAAAADLHLTQSAVSQQIRHLEGFLKQPLFLRRPRCLVLTQAGKNYLPVVNEAFRVLSEGTEAFLGNLDQTSLDIQSNSAFSVFWLMPRIAGFLELYPWVRLNLTTALYTSDFAAVGASVEIRYGRGDWEGVTGQRLADQCLFPVWSPALAQQISGPQDLANIPLIHILGQLEDWDTWLKGPSINGNESIEGIDTSQGHSMITFVLSLEMARQGLGIAMAHDVLATNSLANGSLVEPFDRRVVAQDSYYLIAQPKENRNKAVDAFVQWIEQEMHTG